MNDNTEALDEEFDPVVSLAGPLLRKALADVAAARSMEDSAEGFFRDYRDGTAGRVEGGPTVSRDQTNYREAKIRRATAGGRLTWRHQLEERCARVIAEADEKNLRAFLVHLAELSVSWVEAIDRRKDEKRIARKIRKTWWMRLKAWLTRAPVAQGEGR